MTLAATPALTADEEAVLIVEAKAGDRDAVAAIVQSQVRYLRGEARKFGAASGVDVDDLVQSGALALVQAIGTFDPARGTRLWTHAQHAIASAMRDEVAAFSSTIAVPSRTLKKYRRAIREAQDLVVREVIRPEDALVRARQIARERDGMDEGTFDAVHFAMSGESIDASHDTSDRVSKNGYGGDATSVVMEGGVGNTITTETPLLGSRGAAGVTSVDNRDAVRRALDVLTERQRQIVALAYLTGEDLSDGDIAARLGTSRPTVTRERNAALLAMRGVVA